MVPSCGTAAAVEGLAGWAIVNSLALLGVRNSPADVASTPMATPRPGTRRLLGGKTRHGGVRTPQDRCADRDRTQLTRYAIRAGLIEP